MHGFVLSLERENVFRALAPGLAVGGVDMGENMGNPLLEVRNGISICVEITGTIPLPIKVVRSLESIVAVNGDEKLDAIAVRLYHEGIQAVEHGIIPFIGVRALKAIEGVDWGSLHSSRLAYCSC